MKKFKSVTTLLLSLTIALCGTQAHAMLSVDDDSRNSLTPGVLGGALDGVGRMTISTSSPSPFSPAGTFVGYCSANLLSGGLYAITAAHCVSNSWNTQLSFMDGGVTRGVSQFFLPSGGQWGAGYFGADLAILRLDAPVTTIQGYQLVNDSVLGQTVLMAGYGRVGVGSTGWTNPNLGGSGYFGYNQYDAMLTTRGSQSLNGGIYGFDFDNGSQNQDTMCFLFSACDLGLGNQEASIALGDSGGGSFVWNGSEWLLAGIHSHGWEAMREPCSFDASQICGDFNDLSFDSSFGEIFWDVSVMPQMNWIQAITAGNQVSEPSALALLGLGFFVMTLRVRKAGKVPLQGNPQGV